jgi:hypothetical protein
MYTEIRRTMKSLEDVISKFYSRRLSSSKRVQRRLNLIEDFRSLHEIGH